MSIEFSERKTTNLKDFDYNTPGACFITICTHGRRCILSSIVRTDVPDGPILELTKHGIIADKYINQLNDYYVDMYVDEYVIMPNHIHLLIIVHESGLPRTSVPTAKESIISRFISTFKRFCNKEYGTNIWQYRSYDHIIRDKNDYIKHLKYIHENPMRWYYDELCSGE